MTLFAMLRAHRHMLALSRLLAAIFIVVVGFGCAGAKSPADGGDPKSPADDGVRAQIAQAMAEGAGRFASVNGLRMYYEVHGAGRPLVLIHGGGSTAQTSFGKVIPLLEKNHRIIAPEEQGHGHTGDIDRPFSFEQMADDTAALLEQLEIKEADIYGFSNGGRVALLMAIRHPSVVRKLIIASSFYKRDGLPPQFWEGMQHANPESMPPVLRNAYLAASPKPDLARFVAKTKDMMLSFRDLQPEELRAIHAPTLFMAGDNDVMRPEHVVEMFRLVPHAQLAVFPGSPHGTYMGAAESAKEGSKQPEMAAAMVDDFLNAP